jgi:DAACS family dicarboxylate/amino acid:cation (Na+ or H+) symporter
VTKIVMALALLLLLGVSVARWRTAMLHTKILLGLAIGAVAGITGRLWFPDASWLMWTVDNVANPVGQVFLRMLFMIVIPLIFGSVTLGVASLGDLKKIGRVGGKAFGFFFLTTAAAATIGLTLMNVIAPGRRMDPAVRADLLEEYGGEAADRLGGGIDFGVNTFVEIVPRNIVDTMARMDMLGLIFFSIIFGIALTQIPKAKAQPILDVLDGLVEAVSRIIDYAMRLAPYGVAGLIFAVTVRFGAEVLQSLAFYVGTVMLGLILHLTGVIGVLAKVVVGVPYGTFFRKCRTLMVTAFSTSSSNATLPENIRTAEEEFGVPKEIASFVLPLGATMNMNGTALFEGMTVLFLSQVFALGLGIGDQIVVVVLCVITAVGAAGVPGGSIPLLALILVTVGIPAEGIALILGVDRILDMSRTVPNVMGDQLTAQMVARSEGVVLRTT